MTRVFIICVFMYSVIHSSVAQVILIDPGHGRCDEAIHANPVFGVTFNHQTRLLVELETAVEVGLKLRNLIQSSSCNWSVHMTRENNASGPFFENSGRNALSSTIGADIYLSIHTNAGPVSANGAETFWCVNSTTGSTSFAESLHAIYVNAVASIPIGDRRVAEWKDFIGANNHLTVLNFNTAISALSELGFGTNPTEEAKLFNDANRDIFAEAFFEALQAELNTNCAPGCQPNATVTSTNISGTTVVSNSIISTGNVPATNNAVFDAGRFIDLQTGFEAQPGSVFEGMIGGCSALRRGELNTKHKRLQGLHRHKHPVGTPEVLVYKNSKENTLVFKHTNIDVERITVYSENKEVISDSSFSEHFSLDTFDSGSYYFKFYSETTYIEHVEKVIVL